MPGSAQEYMANKNVRQHLLQQPWQVRVFLNSANHRKNSAKHRGSQKVQGWNHQTIPADKDIEALFSLASTNELPNLHKSEILRFIVLQQET